MQIINKWVKKLTQLVDWPSAHDTTTRHPLGTVVPHDALADLTEQAHSSLTGIGASDHHAKTTSSEIDHGSVGGLADDDHTQYLNTSRHDTTTRHSLGTVVPHDSHGNLGVIGADDHHARDHASRHQNGGADEVSVAGLSGELADRQKSKAGDSGLGWTADKLLKGAGAGSAPTEIDVPGGVSSGLIAMWHGILANIPSGWVLCDGNSGTPNLLDRFVQSVPDASTDPGATGGATSKNLDTSGTDTAFDTPSHYVVKSYVYLGGTNWKMSASGGGGSQTTSPIMWGQISDIRPKYYDIAFIMKT